MADDERPNVFALIAARLSPLWLIVMTAGLYGAAIGWRPGAFLMITALLGYIATHLLIGVTEYRRVMRRPWPRFRLEDDTVVIGPRRAKRLRLRGEAQPFPLCCLSLRAWQAANS